MNGGGCCESHAVVQLRGVDAARVRQCSRARGSAPQLAPARHCFRGSTRSSNLTGGSPLARAAPPSQCTRPSLQVCRCPPAVPVSAQSSILTGGRPIAPLNRAAPSSECIRPGLPGKWIDREPSRNFTGSASPIADRVHSRTAALESAGSMCVCPGVLPRPALARCCANAVGIETGGPVRVNSRRGTVANGALALMAS